MADPRFASLKDRVAAMDAVDAIVSDWTRRRTKQEAFETLMQHHVPCARVSELFTLFANTGHWMDMGGSAPGGWVPTAREIHQEGIIIPPLKLYDAGRRNDGVVAMITANVRMPQQLPGDLAAMTNVFAVGRRGLDALVARYGAPTLKSCIDETIRRSEAQMRSYIEEIPDGVYEITDYFDNDGVNDKRLTVKLTLTVSGSEMA